jgi:hypothetical protein
MSLALLLLALPAAGDAARDAAANRQIDQAINTYYLASDFEMAHKMITATIEACGDKCSPQTLAKAWMYLGLVLGGGKNDPAGAKDAFVRAVVLDPTVKLDAGLATPEVQKIFQETAGTAPGAGQTTEPKKTAPGEAAAKQPGGDGNLHCTPKVTEVETRRPIPVECRTEQDVTSVQLRYKPFGGKAWVTVAMSKKGNSYRAEIPCKETEISGTLELYVRAEDAGGEDVAAWGSKPSPVQIRLVEKSAQEPPAYAETEPPARCATKEDCPPNFPGCAQKKQGGDVDWGGGCENSSQCKSGLLCIDGTCETAPSCTTDSDCPTGSCVQGKCSAEAEAGRPSRGFRKNWFGLHVAQDLAFVGGKNPCSQKSQSDDYFACYYSGSDTAAFVSEAYPGVNVDTGMVVATTRILASYDRAFTPNITAGLRLGWAFGGGPPYGRDVTYDSPQHVGKVLKEGTKFLPIHAELRVSYWFGSNALARKFRPYAHLGGGLAQVDAKFKVPVYDCSTSTDYQGCANGTVSRNQIQKVNLDAWKKLGLSFLTVGGGVVYAIGNRYGIQANLNLMYMLPATSVVVEPSLGAVVGY